MPGTGSVGAEDWCGPRLHGAYVLALPNCRGHAAPDEDAVQGCPVQDCHHFSVSSPHPILVYSWMKL